MKLKDIDNASLKQIAESVQYYLSYLNTVTNLPRQIEESTIRYPVSEYVERKMEVSEAEFEHPMEGFPSKRTDFIFKISENRRFAFEFKYIKNTVDYQPDRNPTLPSIRNEIGNKLNFQLYFNDIVRLAYLNKEYEYRSFFLVAGASIDFSSLLEKDNSSKFDPTRKEKEQRGRFSKYLLSFDYSDEINKRKRSFDASKLYFKKNDSGNIYDNDNSDVNIGDRKYFYKIFCEKYNNDKYTFPENYFGIETTLVSPPLFDIHNNNKQSVGIWEVRYKSQ